MKEYKVYVIRNLEGRRVISPPDKDGAYTIDWASEVRTLENDVLLDRTSLPGEPNGKGYGGYAGYSMRRYKDVSGGTFPTSVGFLCEYFHTMGRTKSVFRRQEIGSQHRWS